MKPGVREPSITATPDTTRATSAPRRRHRLALALRAAVILLTSGALLATGAIWTNTFGAGDRFERLIDRIELAMDPPPDRPTVPTITVTPSPSRPSAAPAPSAGSATPSTKSAATPAVTPSPTPARRRVDVDILRNPESVFSSQLTKDWCAPAGVQMVLTILGLADASENVQRELARRIDEWESWGDSRNGGWGPAAIVEALVAHGATGYQIHAFADRQDALQASAVAISATGKPVILIAWRGAHTWVMHGYRADADPIIFPDARIDGAYILDPWYPRVSSIWGPSDPPGTLQDAAELRRNFLPWERPEGRYPERDGKFLILVPTA
jgi:hypothetical protein